VNVILKLSRSDQEPFPKSTCALSRSSRPKVTTLLKANLSRAALLSVNCVVNAVGKAASPKDMGPLITSGAEYVLLTIAVADASCVTQATVIAAAIITPAKILLILVIFDPLEIKWVRARPGRNSAQFAYLRRLPSCCFGVNRIPMKPVQGRR